MEIIRFILSLLAVSLSNLLVVSIANLKKSEAASQKIAGSIGSEVRTQRLILSSSLRLIFYFLLLNSYFLFPASAWADQVDTLRPAMNQAQDQWFKSPAGDSGYKYIDDVVIDSDTTYLYTAAGNQYQGWLANDFNTSNTIDSVRLVVKARSTATAGTATLQFGRETYAGEGIWGFCPETKTVTLTSTYDSNWAQTWAVDPCNSAAWTTTNLNDDFKAWAFANTGNMGSIPDSFGVTSANLDKKSSGAGYISLYRYQADFTGYIDKLSLYCKTPVVYSNCRLGMYSDSGTSHFPYQLLDTTAEFAIASGWNKISLVSGNISITNGNWYWLAFRLQTNNDTLKNEVASGKGRYKTWAYANGWETPFSGGTAENADYNFQAIGHDGIPQDRTTQSFIVVYSHAGGAVAKRRSGLVQDEENKGVIEGGIAK
jgi:hypothetical protein